MTDKIKFNKQVFDDVHKENIMATQNMVESMKGIGDYREDCTIAVISAVGEVFKEIFDAVDTGKKKIVMHEFMSAPEIYRGFPDIQPYMAECLTGFIPMMDPEGLNPYLETAEALVTSELCPAAKGFLGCILKEAMPPLGAVVMPTTPCDSFGITYQVAEKLLDAPMFTIDVPYWQDEGRNLDYYTHQVWKMIEFIEETCKTKMDWDLLREVMTVSNETLEYWQGDNEMRKIIPCPHGGKVNFYGFMLNFIGAGSKAVRDCWKFVYEDAKKLVAEKRGVIPGGEKARLLLYNPDPFWNAGIHDYLEDEYKAVTAFSFFGHATPTPVDTKTPETMVRDYAWKCMNMCMARQYRGPMEYFMDDFTHVMDNWNIDAVVIPALLECKHGQATHGFVSDACRERDMPLLLLEFSPMDNRPVSAEQMSAKIGEWLETTVLPRVSR
jgi:benzoyl-CoA reductase/2-hydroxyglutaryl-CoA dehydratase subunit BcrC/BadD/HgdB